jgi:homoserine O-acetyltransferase
MICSRRASRSMPRVFPHHPDIIGFGRSSKPSDGLRARFPHYRLHDVAVAQHRLVTEGLNIPHLKLVMGLSLGGMLTWMFGEMFPDFHGRACSGREPARVR